MSFYTNIDRGGGYGNYILYRGYNHNGKEQRITYKLGLDQGNDYRPVLYEKSDKPTEFRTLDGLFVAPRKFKNYSEFENYKKRYEDVDGFKYYGQDRILWQFLQKNFLEISNTILRVLTRHSSILKCILKMAFPSLTMHNGLSLQSH